MKSGARALGIAESSAGGDDRSTLAGAVVRADGVLDGLCYETCTVGATDGTAAVASLLDAVGRPDVRYVLCGAVAPAWYNLLDLSAIHAAADRPVIAVTFEDSDGLEEPLRDAFSGSELETRLDTYRSLPERRALDVDGETVYARALGCDHDEAADVVRGFTLAGGRPEPIRVARVAARAADRFRDSPSE